MRFFGWLWARLSTIFSRRSLSRSGGNSRNWAMSNYPSDFKRAIEIILDLEGGDKVIVDTGGLTKWGISQRAYPSVDIRSLTKEDAMALYYRDYWQSVKAGEMAWPISLFVFDAAVNQGTGAAAKMLQAAAGGLSIDGILGRKSMARIASRPPSELSASFMAKRALRYTGTRKFDKYGYGWFRRLFLVSGRA